MLFSFLYLPFRACPEITVSVCHVTDVAQPLRPLSLLGRDSFQPVPRIAPIAEISLGAADMSVCATPKLAHLILDGLLGVFAWLVTLRLSGTEIEPADRSEYARVRQAKP